MNEIKTLDELKDVVKKIEEKSGNSPIDLSISGIEVIQEKIRLNQSDYVKSIIGLQESSELFEDNMKDLMEFSENVISNALEIAGKARYDQSGAYLAGLRKKNKINDETYKAVQIALNIWNLITSFNQWNDKAEYYKDRVIKLRKLIEVPGSEETNIPESSINLPVNEDSTNVG